MEITDSLLALAQELEQEAPSREAWDGNEKAALLEASKRIRQFAEARSVAGYVIAERHTFGPNEGKLDADWDGEIHPTREAAAAEMALANGQDGCCEGAHWKLYELREVTE